MARNAHSLVVGLAVALGAGGCAGMVDGDGIGEPTSALGSGGTIVRAGSGKCLDVAGAGDGASVRQWSCNATGAQTFRIDDAGSGQVNIAHPSSGKCVDINGAGTANGTKIQLWACNGSVAQAWMIEAQGNGYSRLRNPHSNKCVDVSGASNADGANVQLYNCNGTAAQQWKIVGGGGPPPGGFAHPGVLVDKGQLDFVKAKIQARQEPWLSAYNNASSNRFGSLGYTPHPRADVQCGPISNPDIGCTDEKNDSAAAYTHALLWYFGGDPAHAKKAIEIMNAWSSTIVSHGLANAPLESAWVGSLWPRAAEIIRYSYSGWSADDVNAFKAMLKQVYLPEVIHGSSSNGNWELSMIEASIGIGVFLDDHATFDTAVAMWKKRVPAYIYLTSDGANPVPPPTGNASSPGALKGFWYNPTQYVEGLSQETCRDLGHVQYGFAAITNAAETARIQGIDLYTLEQKRLSAGYEFHAKYLDGTLGNTTAICGANLKSVSPDPMWEIAYNALANRLGVALPETSKLVRQIRPSGSDHHMEWETLTHAEIGAAGIP